MLQRCTISKCDVNNRARPNARLLVHEGDDASDPWFEDESRRRDPSSMQWESRLRNHEDDELLQVSAIVLICG